MCSFINFLMNFIATPAVTHVVMHLLSGLKLGWAGKNKMLGDIRAETDETQWGVNAFLVDSVLLLSHLLVTVNNKIQQWRDAAQCAEHLHDQKTHQ